MTLRERALFLSITILAFGCSKKITGPTPGVSGVTPPAVCQAQLTTSVSIAGAGLSPLYTGALADGTLELPAVTLSRVQDINGAPAAGPAVPIPDDPSMPATSHVRWESQEKISFDVFPELALETGLYDVQVKNANGKTGSFPASLLAVPPPVLSNLGSDILCGGKENDLDLVGDFFIKSDTTQPKVTIGTLELVPTAMSECRPLPGTSGLSACKKITVKLLAGALKEGNYPVKVTNPDPVGCVSSEAVDLTIVPEPMISDLEPEAACAIDGAVNVTVTGTGFLSIDGVQPGVLFGNMSLPGMTAMCMPVMGPMGNVQTCTQVTFTIPKGTTGGNVMVAVQNPAPADCMSNSKPFWLFDSPDITKAEPASLCNRDNTAMIVLTGTNFIVVGNQAPTVKIDDMNYMPTPGGCTDVQGTDPLIKVCTMLTVTVNPMQLVPGKRKVTVTNPAPVACGTDGTDEIDVAIPPDLQAALPSQVCAGDATLTLNGTNFSPNATVTVNGVEARMVTVMNNGMTAVAAFGGGLPAGGPYDVTISNGGTCSDTLAGAVRVVPGPAIFFVDPEVVYNGLNIQATLYGTGFTNPVTKVEISPDGNSWTEVMFTQDAQKPNRVQILLAKGTAPGYYDVRLTDSSGAGCQAVLVQAFSITDTTTVQLASITPPFGWQQESTGVTIKAASAADGFVAVPRVYLNPVNAGQNTVATALGVVSFVDATTLTALVPAGLPVGQYDVIVVNPDGTVGVLSAGFRVVADAPPTIESLSPGQVANGASETFDVIGKNFRQPSVSLACIDSGGAPIMNNPTATVSNPSATRVTVTFNASMAGAACVVRLTNGDNNTYDEFSALVITNPAQNLYPAKSGPDLAVGRRAPVALDGHASNAARFLHVLGGDNGAGAGFDTVESSPLSLFGVPAGFFSQKTKLTTPRAFSGGVRIGRFLYLAGGSNGNTRHATVERAVVLDPDQRGEVVDLALEVADQGVGPGVWYYRVAAVRGANDPFNPNGENLPSDPFPVRVPELQNKKSRITVIWKDQGAANYRVYRSPTAGAQAGTEQLIAEVAGNLTQFTDAGIAPIATDTPLPVGSLGRWNAVAATMATPREGAGVTWALDPGDATKAYLYVVGGRSAANTVLASYEFLPITLNPDGSQTPAGAFTAGTQALGAGRWQLAASQASSGLNSKIAAGTTYIYALSGVAANGTTVVKDAEAAQVQAGGQLGAFVDLHPQGLGSAGYYGVVAANLVFAFGGSNAQPSDPIWSAIICSPGTMGCIMQTPPYVQNFNTGQDMLEARYLMGGTLSGAFIYIAAGVNNLTGPVLSKTTEYRLW